MRLGISFMIAVCVAALYLSDQPAHFSALLRGAKSSYQQVFYQRQLEMRGLKILGREEVEALLPTQRSNLHWLVKRSLIETSLLSSALVHKASLRRCSMFSFNCFVLEVAERKAGFFATSGEGGWLIGIDGGVIMPVSRDEIEAYWEASQKAVSVLQPESRRRLPVVRGLWAGSIDSPDVVRYRFEHVRRAIQVIEEAAGLSVVYLELGDQQEATVRFAGYEFRATFEIRPGDIWGEAGSPVLRDRAERLKALLSELGARSRQIESVDLGFEKLAVVRMKKIGTDPN